MFLFNIFQYDKNLASNIIKKVFGLENKFYYNDYFYFQYGTNRLWKKKKKMFVPSIFSFSLLPTMFSKVHFFLGCLTVYHEITTFNDPETEDF